MRHLLRAGLLALLPLCGSASAMEMHTCGNQIILSGDVQRGDYAALRDALAANPVIDTVVLRNSRGGDAETGYDVGALLREKRITTWVSGYCRSSCSRMFLGGFERFFTDDFAPSQTSVGFHSNYNSAGLIVSGAPERLVQFVRTYSGGKADEALVARWAHIENRNGFAHFFHPQSLQRKDGVSVLLCNGTEGNERWRLCEKVTGHDALSMGIITGLDLKHACDAATLVRSP